MRSCPFTSKAIVVEGRTLIPTLLVALFTNRLLFKMDVVDVIRS